MRLLRRLLVRAVVVAGCLIVGLDLAIAFEATRMVQEISQDSPKEKYEAGKVHQ